MAKKSAPQAVEQDDSWKHEQDARTLMDAGEIMQDPERMKNAHKHIKKKAKALKTTKDMIAKRNSNALSKRWDKDQDGDNKKADMDQDGE